MCLLLATDRRSDRPCSYGLDKNPRVLPYSNRSIGSILGVWFEPSRTQAANAQTLLKKSLTSHSVE